MTLSPLDDRDPAPVGRDWAALNVQLVRCPFCLKLLPGLLAGCDEDDCRRLENAEDHAYTRSLDV
ncbi:hypothetical protein K1W54_04955 [Micromonospora sp. CPCC 205371]|nr:hypothetical protein [Micromonospora sp. CPCC 205371]